MSNYHPDKCTKEELVIFKKKVLVWLAEKGVKNKKIRALTCYNGDVRVYTGEFMEYPNKKESFRRQTSDKNEKGEITGWNGTRGHHITKIANYVSFNRDEWDKWLNMDNPKDDFDADFYQGQLKSLL